MNSGAYFVILEQFKKINSPDSSAATQLLSQVMTSLFQERDVNEESGWKLVHGDVFRPPRSLTLLSALVGIGTQLAALILLVIVLAIVGMLYVGYAQNHTHTFHFLSAMSLYAECMV